MSNLPAVRARDLYVWFEGGAQPPWRSKAPRPFVRYTPPTNTLDPRFDACASHHTACDCREAIWNEDRLEVASVFRGQQAAVARILVGHPTYADDPCMCTGCQISRDSHIFNTGALRV